MSKCENCIHYDVCCEMITKHNKLFFVCGDKGNEGQHYKDKSLIVELPCEIGCTKFVKSKNKNKIMLCEVSGFFIDKNILVDVIFEKDTNSFWFEQFSADELFDSKEDAQRKLKELEGK